MARLRNTREAYGWVSIALHWSVAALFLGEVAVGFLTQRLADRPALQFSLYQWHKSFGFLVLVLAILRIGWRLVEGPPSHLAMQRMELAAARIAQWLLLLATLAVPLAGWAIASASPLRIPSLAFDTVLVPDLPLPVSDLWELRFSWLHAVLAYAAGALAFLHAAAALRHHFLLHDRTLGRMLSPR